MREVSVFFNKTLAGKLTEESAQSYVFEYDKSYLANSDNPSIAYEFPKTQTKFRSNALFPFFCQSFAGRQKQEYLVQDAKS